MADGVPISVVRGALLAMLGEVTSCAGHSYALDGGTSLLETLAGITAEEASRPVSRQSASLAAQVNHVRFYVDTLLEQPPHPDWDGSWRVGPVDAAGWRELVDRLEASVARARAFIETFEGWDEHYLGGAVALVTHTAYHLGEIRQGIGVIRHPITAPSDAAVPGSTQPGPKPAAEQAVGTQHRELERGEERAT